MNENRRHIAEEDSIDLLEIFRVLGKNILVLILVALIFGAAFTAFTKFFIPATYTSTARMIVLTKETTLSSLADLQLGKQLTGDYSELIVSPPVLNEVVENLKLDDDYKQLKRKISVSNPDDTRILALTVTDTDPVRACETANELASVSSAYISDIMEVTPPKIFSEAEIPTGKAAPNLKRNGALGAILGLILAAIIILIRNMLDDSIKSEEDIQKHLGLPTLAVVPDRNTVKRAKGYGYYNSSPKGSGKEGR